MSPSRFKLTTAVINHLLKTFTIFLFIASLVGCNNNDDDGSSRFSSQTPASTPISPVQVMSTSPLDIAVIGETYSSPVGVVAIDPNNKLKSYKISRVSGAGSVPTVDTSGVLTWTPVDTEWGAHIFKLEVQGLDGEPQTHQFKIDVVKRKSQIDVTVGNEGGTFSDVEGRYLVEIKPNSIEAPALSIHLRVDEFSRDDGSFAISPQVDGINNDGISFLRVPKSLLSPTSILPPVAKSFSTKMKTNGGRAASTQPFIWIENVNLTGSPKQSPLANVSSTGVKVITNKSRNAVLFTTENFDSVMDRVAKLNGGLSYTKTQSFVEAHKLFQIDGNCDDVQVKCADLTGIPVILVHGFQLNFGYYDITGGGRGEGSTWGYLPDYLASYKNAKGDIVNRPVFDFRWITYTRFEEAAGRLAELVDAVTKITGKKPILVSHSFGGIVASTLLAGKAEQYRGVHWDSIPYTDGVDRVVTLGSPLSGVADDTTDFLTYGRDTNDVGINSCRAITCLQAGATDLDEKTVKSYSDYYNTKSLVYAGSTIGQLHGAWKNGNVKTPYYSLIGLKIPRAETATGAFWPSGFQWEKFGDGLIGIMGQAIIPSDFAVNPFVKNVNGSIGSYNIAGKLGANFYTELMDSAPNKMKSLSVDNRTYYFAPFAAHTLTHEKNTPNYVAEYGEAFYPENGQVKFCQFSYLNATSCKYVDHPLKFLVDTQINGAVVAPVTVVKPTAKNINFVIKPPVSTTNLANTRAASQFDSTWNTSITIIKKNVGFMRLYMVKTDSNGHLTFDFGSAIGLIESNPDLSQYVLDVVVGDDIRGRQISQRVDGLEKDDINLVTIQLDPVNTPLTSTSGFVFDSNNKTQPIANAKVYLSLGINQDSSIVTKVTTSNTSRVVTTDATGKFSLANVSAGSYTVVVEKAGYKTKSIPNVEVGNGATITLYSGDAIVVPQPTISVSSISPVQAVLNQKTTFTLTGTGFVTGMAYAIADCDSVEGISTIATELKFACTPKGTIGLKTLTLKDKPAGKVVYTGQVTVVNQTTPVPTISVSSISPAQAVLNQKTTFTLTGTGFVAGMAYTIADCDSVEGISTIATELKFACTPKGTIGVKTLTVKDKPAGTVLYTGQVTVVNQPTPVPTISVSIISPVQAVLNEKTTFTLTGTGFLAGMTYTIQDCEGFEGISASATEVKFACRPVGAIGVRPLVIKDKPDGTVIYTVPVTVKSPPSTSGGVTVKGIIWKGLPLEHKVIISVIGSGFTSDNTEVVNQITSFSPYKIRIENCTTPERLRVTSTAYEFSCVLSGTTLQLDVLDLVNSKTIYSQPIILIATNPFDPTTTPQVPLELLSLIYESDIAPKLSFSGQRNTFTLTGNGFFTGMDFSLKDCDNQETISVTETEAKFSCIPNGPVNDSSPNSTPLMLKIFGQVYADYLPQFVGIIHSPIIDVSTTMPAIGDSIIFTLKNSAVSFLNALWDFGEGVVSTITGVVSHIFNSMGSQTVTATFQDGTGQTIGKSQVQFTVQKYKVVPTEALLDKKTTFTLTGNGFFTGMGYTITDCEGLALVSLSSTEFKFSCTPKGTTGIKTLTLKDNPNGAVVFTSKIGVVQIASAVSKLNDTGITTCATEASFFIDCTLARLGDFFDLGQDADVGRDTLATVGALVKKGGGSAGFDFTKVSATGQLLPNDALGWKCVLDNNTGLMWQRENDDSFRSGYVWYNTNNQTNGGYAGSTNGAGNDTESLVARTNLKGFCGYKDWRLPTDQELISVVDYGKKDPSPRIDTDFFPEMKLNSYWTSSPSVENVYAEPDSPVYRGPHASAWVVNFKDGRVYYELKGNGNYALLVRPHQ